MSRRDHDGGFSLIEAVAALAVMALFALMMSSMSTLVARNATATANKADAVEQFATGLSALRREISAAMWVEAGAGTSRTVLFSGDRSGMAFVAPGQVKQPDRLVAYYVTPIESGSALMRRSSITLPGIGDFNAAWNAPQEVLRVESGIEFTFARRLPNGSLEWSEEWSSSLASLPGAVRLRFPGFRNQASAIPDLVILLRINAPPTCRVGNCETRAAQMVAME